MKTNDNGELEFRLLNADEIRVREGARYANGSKKTLLLYKDARADMRRLDKEFGVFGWQREHKDVHGVSYCGVSLWDKERGCWVAKWDAGEPSKTSPQKGEASDAFKRACVNWGIGRELYTAPFLGVDVNVDTQGLKVSHIAYENRRIIELTIIDKDGKVVIQKKERKEATNAAPIEKKGGAIYPAKEPTEDQRYLAAYNECCKAHDINELKTIWARHKSESYAARLSPKVTEIINLKGWQ